MSEIRKKCYPKFFEDIKSGKKTFEVRLADFDCNVGDTLIIEEWNPETGKYTGRSLRKRITYLLKTKELEFYHKKDIAICGYLIMSLGEEI